MFPSILSACSFAYYWQFLTENATVEIDENLRLLRMYRLTGNVSYRNEIVMRNNLLIYKETHRHSRSEDDFAELYPEAVLGFIDGVEKYSLSKSIASGRLMKLTSYCVIRIRKAIFHYREATEPLVRWGWRVQRGVMNTNRMTEQMPDEEKRETLVKLMASRTSANRAILIEALRYSKQEIYEDIMAVSNEEEEDTGKNAVHLLYKCPTLTQEEKDKILAYFEGGAKHPSYDSIRPAIEKLKQWVGAEGIKHTNYNIHA